MSVKIIVGDCRVHMAAMDPESISAVVTDPPYDLTQRSATTYKSAFPGRYAEAECRGGFMGMKWDGTGVAFEVETWRAAFRVLKPGGHLLAFGGTRTFHRMTVAIEDAGFEIRDCLSWLYGSGFPKSLDVSKAIDKAAGVDREVVGPNRNRKIGGAGGVSTNHGRGGIAYGPDAATAPTTPAAERWDGWGTALKPAWEPIIVARKPFRGTVAANVLTHGTGAINIDGCRIGTDEAITNHSRSSLSAVSKGIYGDSSEQEARQTDGQAIGRWPANVVLSCCGNDPHDPIPCFGPSVWRDACAHAPLLTRLLGYPLCCPSCLRFCDARLQSAIGDARELVPSQHDALAAVAMALRQRLDNLTRRYEPGRCSSDSVPVHETPVSTQVNRTVSRLAGQKSFDTPDMSSAGAFDSPPSSNGGSNTAVSGNLETHLHSDCISAVASLLFRACADLALGDPFAPIIPEYCVTAMLDAQSGERPSGFSVNRNRDPELISNQVLGARRKDTKDVGYGDTGGASRFFYTAKSSRSERNKGLDGMPIVRTESAVGMSTVTAANWGNPDETVYERTTSHQNHHPTVKPVDLMQWLVRLVTPPGGIVLDPFMGSGSTCIAADREGFDCIGIEISPEYVEIARRRIVGDCPMFATVTS